MVVFHPLGTLGSESFHSYGDLVGVSPEHLNFLMSSTLYFPHLVMCSNVDFRPRNIFPSGLRNHCIATEPFLVFMSVTLIFQPRVLKINIKVIDDI